MKNRTTLKMAAAVLPIVLAIDGVATAEFVDRGYSQSQYPKEYWGPAWNIDTFCNNTNLTQSGGYYISTYSNKARGGNRTNCLDTSKWKSKFKGIWYQQGGGDYVNGKGWNTGTANRKIGWRLDTYSVTENSGGVKQGRSWFGL